jgi:NAD(P)-dependent dehydrogenase (short-subunit alcohol dehydrogenase family)
MSPDFTVTFDPYAFATVVPAPDAKAFAVNPGVVVTNLHRRGGMDETKYAEFLERSKTTHPLGRPGRPEEIADLIAYLRIL